MKIKSVCTLAILAFTLADCAQAQSPSQPTRGGWEWGGYIEHINIDPEVASREWIEDSANALALGAEYYVPNSMLTLGGGFEFLAYSDKADFSQRVEDIYGDTRSESSDASAAAAYAEVGLNFPLDAMFITAKLGANTLFSSSRSISNCEDCYEDDIDINGGAYLQAQFGTVIGWAELSLVYKHYLSGDLESAAGVSLTRHFF